MPRSGCGSVRPTLFTPGDGVSPMEIASIAGLLPLFLLMFIIGMELTPADFARVFEAPRAVVGGTLGQWILLPLMTWFVVWAFDLEPAFVCITPLADRIKILESKTEWINVFVATHAGRVLPVGCIHFPDRGRASSVRFQYLDVRWWWRRWSA